IADLVECQHRLILPKRAPAAPGGVVRGDHGLDPGEPRGGRDVDGPDMGVRQWAAEDGPVQQTRPSDIADELGRSERLGRCVISRHALADNRIRLAHESAAASTASTILAYPVQRHRFPTIHSATSWRVGRWTMASRALAAMIWPGVQAP